MRKHCRRKPGKVEPWSWFNALANAAPPEAGDITKIMVLIHIAYEALKTGAGTDDDYDTVSAMVNVGLVRAESIGEALVDVFKEGGQAMLECERIRRRHGRYGFTGPHLQVMSTALDAYEQVLSMSSRNQMADAGAEADRRLARGEAISA
jgi:hypothetical protein